MFNLWCELHHFWYSLSFFFHTMIIIKHNEIFMKANEWSHLSFGTCYYSSTRQKSSFNSPLAANSGFSCKTFLVFAKDIYFSKSSLSIRIRDSNVSPTLNSLNFKSDFENYCIILNIF